MSTQAKVVWPLKIRAGSVTVKIYQTPTRGHEAYTIAYHEGARRMRRMLADLGKARKEAKLIAERLNAGRGAALELTGHDRDAYLDSKALLKPLNIGLYPAVQEFVAAKKWPVPLAVAAKAYHESHNSKHPARTVSEVFQELLVAQRTDGASEAYLHDLKSRLGHFSRDFGTNIADVTTADLDAWLRALKLAPRSRNNYRNAVLALFKFAKDAGYLTRDRATVAQHAARAKAKRKPITFFSPEDFAKLLATDDRVILPLFVLGGFCGLRTEEVLRLSWEDFRWEGSNIIISAEVSKQGEARRRRIAPLTAPAAAWLAGWKSARGRVLPLKQPEHRVKSVCEKVGVKWKRNGLRHSFITHRVATEKDFVRVAYEAGNSPEMIRSNYDAVATEAEGKRWFSIMPTAAKNVVRMDGAA